MAIATVFGILLVTAIGVIAYALRQRFQSNGTSNSSSSSSSFLEEGNNDEPQQKLDPTTATTIADDRNIITHRMDYLDIDRN
mmetsp:Transcript_3143/g.3472  ORF Transcript_3143/g.3472 Transcript_3143/m.3472 type:complete len:82 (+) Transcript_3143:355-600(+)